MINKNRLIKTFLQLVRINSPSGQEEQVADFVLKKTRSLGFRAKKDRVNNVIINIPGPGESLFLNAHLDTVQPGENIKPIIKNGRIKSAGQTILGADNKVAVAALLEILHAYKNYQPRSLEIIFTVAEETSGTGALKINYKNLRAKKGYCFDCGQPLGGIVLASPYYLDFDLNIKGQEAHAAYPEKAINALVIANQIINKLTLGKLDRQSIFNIGLIKGGTARNTIPGQIQLHGEIRSYQPEKIKQYQNFIQKQIKSLIIPARAKIQLNLKAGASGYIHQKTDPLIKRTEQTIKNIGLKPYYLKLWTCSDANIFNEKKLQVINISDGVKNIHTTRETVSVNDLIKLTRLIQKLIKE